MKLWFFLICKPCKCMYVIHIYTVCFPDEKQIASNILTLCCCTWRFKSSRSGPRGSFPFSLFSLLFLLTRNLTLSVADSGDPWELYVNWKFERYLIIASVKTTLLLLNLSLGKTIDIWTCVNMVWHLLDIRKKVNKTHNQSPLKNILCSAYDSPHSNF